MTFSLIHHLEEAGLRVRKNLELDLPEWVTRVKIDGGLSYSARNSVTWLREDPGLLVFGFEPLPESCTRLRKWLSDQPDAGDLVRRLIIAPVALGRESGKAVLHVTAGDTASSSLLNPKSLEQRAQIQVDVVSLTELLNAIPRDRFARIDYLKLDCQGMDLEILKGAGLDLARIALITAEAENDQYDRSNNSLRDLVSYMNANNFVHLNPRSQLRVELGKILSRLKFTRSLGIRLPVRPPREVASSRMSVYVDDPTFINRKFLKDVMSGKVTGFQQG